MLKNESSKFMSNPTGFNKQRLIFAFFAASRETELKKPPPPYRQRAVS
jgi:hypothetical protein